MANESNTKKVLKKATFGFVLLPAAIFIFIVAIGLLCSLPKNRVETTAVIREIRQFRETTGKYKHKVYVDYEVDGITYIHVYLNEYVSSWREGDTITLLYNQNDVMDIASTSRQTVSYVMFGLGGALLIAGVANFVIELAKIKEREPVDTILENDLQDDPPPKQEFLDLSENDNKKKKRKKDDGGLVDDPFGK